MIKLRRYFTMLSIFLFILLLSGCEERVPQTVEGFAEIMESKGFEVRDVIDDIKSEDIATAALIAEGENYQVGFFEFVDSEIGKKMFLNYQAHFEAEDLTFRSNVNINLFNYDYYTLSGDGKIRMIARIDNTMVYCVTDSEYGEELAGVLELLGYK